MIYYILSSLALSEESSSVIDVHATLRLNATQRPGFAVDFEGEYLEEGWSFDSRLRSGMVVQEKAWSFTLDGDIFHGQFAGTPWNLSGVEHRYHPERIGLLNPDNFALRNANLKAKIGAVGILAGVVTSHWGMGLVSNDGAHEREFGRADYGDRMLRMALSTKMSDVVYTLAGDFVLEDDIGGASDSYRSYQGLFSVNYIPAKHSQIGILGVYRHQTDIETEQLLRGFFIDSYAKTQLVLGSVQFEGEAEVAYLHGQTDRITNRNNPDGLPVRSLGAAFRVEAKPSSEEPSINISGGVNGGYASGDADPSDGLYSTFTFDRDHNAGAFLFDLHQAAREVAEHNLLIDPEHAGQPPDGVDSLVTEGAIRQTMYLQPFLNYTPVKQLQLRLGSVHAWSTTPIRSAFISYRNGGVALNYAGEEADGYFLGSELNWRLTAENLSESTQWLSVFVEGAHLLPSKNLSTEEILSSIRVQSEFSW
ncbi:MAG: hypothetical protein VX278_23655 [Myxococcota bacterium]|nr:hypothetical protein [Myxococcota bacterium]